ncbi:CDP-glucose 4,6-dehydratase [Ginsengibacter hankyongi]|uniref:CDP-glucose 4,6-dehydratase n=1 Tax=Ginsengibacter hankyongi TaxID=2607284 RepID=A0A5J5IKD0_9BACT|nr:CDP-glucose 4,6-dehydratase [Ginsengibacter hankyongi]KAA9041018.1 CDP-glucose 4,6-dehydratase [Ginsengibacter hankyongi]
MESLVNQITFEKFYKGKRIFVTGHTGFKGAWFITWLHTLGAEIKGYALAPGNGESIYNIIAPHVPHTSVIADIRDKGGLEKEIADFKPDFIFHFAAQALVRRSYNIPAETFDVNVVGTANVLESMISLQHKCTAIIITTDKVYENKEEQIPFIETDRLGGHDPYSASKACTEIVVQSFSKSFFNIDKFGEHQKTIASARAGNVIGGGDWNEDRIVPDIVKHLKEGKKIPVRNPYAVRPWQHVLEPLGGYLLAAGILNENENLARAYNFGPEIQDHLKVKDLVKIAIDCWESGEWLDVSDMDQPHEAGILKLDINLAKKDLNWQPKLDSKLAIKWTIDWYSQKKNNLYDFTLQQIRKYQSI